MSAPVLETPEQMARAFADRTGVRVEGHVTAAIRARDEQIAERLEAAFNRQRWQDVLDLVWALRGQL